MKNKFYLNLVTSYRNTGDLLINKTLVELLSEHGEVIINSKFIPEEFFNELTENAKNVVTSPKFYSSLFKDAVSRKDNIFIIGIPGHFFGKGTKLLISTLVSGVLFHVLSMLKVNILKFGSCAGPFSPAVLIAEKFRAKAFKFYGLRDSISLSYLGKSKKVQFFPDLAFLSQDILKMKNQEKKKQIVISFRDSTNAMYVNKKYIETIIPKLELLIESYSSDHKLIFCYQVPSDKEVVASLFSHFNAMNKNECSFIEEKLDLKAAIKLFSLSSLVLSNRLHILLPSLILNTPHLAIIDKKNHHKISGIYQDLNLSELILDVKDIKKEKQALISMTRIFSDATTNQKTEKVYQQGMTTFKQELSRSLQEK